jgi:hypothetical protein
MAISISIEADTGMAIATCSGVLQRRDAQEGAAALWKAPGWLGTVAVWDFRDARFEMESPQIREIARFVVGNQPDPPPARVAFVAPRDVDFGLARMFEVFREDPRTEFRVFRDYYEALDWARIACRDARSNSS